MPRTYETAPFWGHISSLAAMLESYEVKRTQHN